MLFGNRELTLSERYQDTQYEPIIPIFQVYIIYLLCAFYRLIYKINIYPVCIKNNGCVLPRHRKKREYPDQSKNAKDEERKRQTVKRGYFN